MADLFKKWKMTCCKPTDIPQKCDTHTKNYATQVSLFSIPNYITMALVEIITFATENSEKKQKTIKSKRSEIHPQPCAFWTKDIILSFVWVDRSSEMLFFCEKKQKLKPNRTRLSLTLATQNVIGFTLILRVSVKPFNRQHTFSQFELPADSMQFS